MATTTPPPPPTPAAPRPAGNAPQPSRRPGAARYIAFIVIGLLILAALYLLFSGGSSATYSIIFNDSAQLVRGDQVQVGGVPVGSVTEITLTKDFKAKVTFEVESSLAPLHQGTTAQIRQPSLSSVANRFIDIQPGPNNNPALPEGSTIPASATKSVTNIDELFNTLNPATRKGLQQFIQGTATQYENQSKGLGESVEFFAPAFNATSQVFNQLVRDQPSLTRFLVEAAKTVSVVGARSSQLEGLVENGSTTFHALGSDQAALAAALHELPRTIHQGNQTFAGVPATLASLTKLIETAKPTTPSLIELLHRLTPLAHTATAPVTSLANAISKPGANNDLTELALTVPELYKVLKTASPTSVRALKESVPITAFFGPYSPDLVAGVRSFGQVGGYYDANGHYVHISPVFSDFKLGAGETLKPVNSSIEGLESLISQQLRRCPGAATRPAEDGSSPFEAGGTLSCNPLEVP